MKASIKVFIQNEAGSNVKHRHNEKTLELLGSILLHEPYPFPYGFVLATTTDDGDNVDSFIITRKKLETGSVVDCHVMGLLEVFENGARDHKVVAVFQGEPFTAMDESLASIRRFYQGLSIQFSDTVFKTGEFLPAESAIAFINRSIDNRET